MKYTAFAFVGIALVLGLMMADFNQNTQEVYGKYAGSEELYMPKDLWHDIQIWLSGGNKLTDISYDDFTPEEQELIKIYTGGRPLEEYTVNFCQVYGTQQYYEMKASIEDSNPETDIATLFFFFDQIAATCQ